MPALYGGTFASIESVQRRFKNLDKHIAEAKDLGLLARATKLTRERRAVDKWFDDVDRYLQSLDKAMKKKYPTPDGNWMRGWILKKSA